MVYVIHNREPNQQNDHWHTKEDVTKGNPQQYAYSINLLIELTQKHTILHLSNYIFQFTTAIFKIFSLWRQLGNPRIPDFFLKFPNPGNNVDSTLICQSWFIDTIQRWNNIDSGLNWKTILFSYHDPQKKKNYIIVDKITVFQLRNSVSLSTLNQRRNLTLKQRWFWVDSKNNFALISWCLKN